MLQERISQASESPPPCLRAVDPQNIREFFGALLAGLNDFTTRMGSESTFHGLLDGETQPALVLSMLEEMYKSPSGVFHPRLPTHIHRKPSSWARPTC